MNPLARFLGWLSETPIENLAVWRPFNWVINRIWPPDRPSGPPFDG